MPDLRLATPRDIPELQALIEVSVRALSIGIYTPAQTEAALVHMFGVDSQLVADGTYYVIENESTLVAAGGWSARRTLYGGDQAKRETRLEVGPGYHAGSYSRFLRPSRVDATRTGSPDPCGVRGCGHGEWVS